MLLEARTVSWKVKRRLSLRVFYVFLPSYLALYVSETTNNSKNLDWAEFWNGLSFDWVLRRENFRIPAIA
jgi:hypothetical protein